MAEKSLFGFITQPNPAGRYIEDYLGLHLKEMPPNIYYNFWNTHVLSLKNRNRKAEFLEEEEADARLHVAAYYDPRFRACFYYKDAGFPEMIHETLHAAVDQLNPSLTVTPDQFQNADSQAKERLLTTLCLHEGIARWGTVAALSAGQETASEARAEHFKCMPSELPDTYEEVKGYLEVTRAYKDLYKFYLEDKMVDTLSLDISGYVFIHYVMQKLRKILPIGQALTHIITHPPTTFSELQDPEGYATGLLKRLD